MFWIAVNEQTWTTDEDHKILVGHVTSARKNLKKIPLGEVKE